MLFAFDSESELETSPSDWLAECDAMVAFLFSLGRDCKIAFVELKMLATGSENKWSVQM